MAQKIHGLEQKLKHAERVLKQVKLKWRQRKGVVGLGVGIKLTGGKSTERVAIHVYVEEKMANDELQSTRRKPFPKSVRGVPVDVIAVTGRHTVGVHVESAAAIFAESNPGNQGTLGFVLRRLDAPGVHFLTCAHLAPVDDRMDVAAGKTFIGKVPADTDDVINSEITPRVDWAAIRSAVPAASVTMGIVGAPGPYAVGTAKVGDVVFRVDRAAGKVPGRVAGLNVSIDLGGDPSTAKFMVAATGDPPFTIPGDSGAMLLRTVDGKNLIVGLLFGEFLDEHGKHVASAACAFDEVNGQLRTDFANT